MHGAAGPPAGVAILPTRCLSALRSGQAQEAMALRIMRSMPTHPGGDLGIRPAAQGKAIDLALTLAAANGGEHRLAAGQTHGLADVWPDRAQPG